MDIMEIRNDTHIKDWEHHFSFVVFLVEDERKLTRQCDYGAVVIYGIRPWARESNDNWAPTDGLWPMGTLLEPLMV
jgi:hypothetical protein